MTRFDASTGWVGYLRVSTSAQAIDGNGLDVQRASIEQWVAGHGGKLKMVCEDAGVSGTVPMDQREGLVKAVYECQRYGYRGIVAYRLDRFSRDPVGLEVLLREFTRMGIEMHSCSNTEDGLVGTDKDDPARTMVRQILAAVSEYERAMARFRMTAGHARKRAAGGYIGGQPPYGFERDPHNKGELREIPTEIEALANALTMRELGASYQTIGAYFEAHGLRLRKGKQWHAQTVKSTLDACRRRANPQPAELSPLARHFLGLPAVVTGTP